MGLPWDYLLNVTELGVAVINGDVEMIEKSLKGICVYVYVQNVNLFIRKWL